MLADTSYVDVIGFCRVRCVEKRLVVTKLEEVTKYHVIVRPEVTFS